MLAVTSVDGVNVISGETAARNRAATCSTRWDSRAHRRLAQEPRRSRHVLLHAAADSYAARTGRPDDVGVIGVALFRDIGRRTSRAATGCEERAAASAAPEASAETSDDAEERRDSSGARQRAQRIEARHRPRPSRSFAGAVRDFQRASSTPDETIVIYYDSRKNLLAQGVMPQPHAGTPTAARDPFPNGFVPDP